MLEANLNYIAKFYLKEIEYSRRYHCSIFGRFLFQAPKRRSRRRGKTK